MKNVTIYSTPTCHFCAEAKKFFAANDIVYTEYNVASDMEKRREMVDKSGQLGVPVIEINGQVIVGYDEDMLKQTLEVK